MNRDEQESVKDMVRDAVDALVAEFGNRFLEQGADDTKAWAAHAYRIHNSDWDQEALAAMLAFATRRLWIKRADRVRISVN